MVGVLGVSLSGVKALFSFLNVQNRNMSKGNSGFRDRLESDRVLVNYVGKQLRDLIEKSWIFFGVNYIFGPRTI